MVQYGVTELAELVKLVGTGVISEPEAARRTANPDWVWDDRQVHAAVQYIDRTRCQGDLKLAQTFSSLLLSAVEHRQLASWQAAAQAFVQVATEVVAEDCDSSFYLRAARVADQLLIDADANTLLVVARSKLEPFAVDPIRGSFPGWNSTCEARRARRPFASSADPLPVTESLTEAQALFARFAEMTVGVARGVALVEQAYAAYSLGQAGVDVDSESYLSLCAEGWPLLGGEPLGTARACWLLAHHNAWHRVSPRKMVLPEAAMLIEAYGPRTASVIIATSAVLFGRPDPGVVHDRCVRAMELLPDDGYASQRSWLRRILAHLMPDDPTDCVSAAVPGAVSAIADRGRVAGWTPAQVCAALVHALAHDDEGLPADEALISAQVRGSAMFRQVFADRDVRLASALLTADEETSAVVCLLRAAMLHALSGAFRDAEGCLHVVATTVETSHDAACVTVDALTELADALADSLGQVGITALNELYVLCFRHLNEEGRSLPLWALMQLAKGRAFARFQAAQALLVPPPEGTPFEIDAFAEAEAAAHAMTPHERGRSPEAPDFIDFAPFYDGNGFLGAYLTITEVQDGRNPIEELANRRRICHQIDAARLQHRTPGGLMIFRDGPDVIRAFHETGLAPILNDHAIRASLPEDAVLVSIYERSVLTPAQPGIIYSFATAQTQWSVTVAYRGSQAQNQVEMEFQFLDGGTQRAIRFTPAAYRTTYVRRLLLEDPLHRNVSREAEAALFEEALTYEGLLDQLAQLHASGKRRLIIWPHGAYYFYPFHLLPTAPGRIVGDDWTVVLVPSLQPVTGVLRHNGRSSVLAMASSTGGTPFGLPAEPEVVRQASAVAAVFGATPLVDGDVATTEHFLASVGDVRFIHLAAHGAPYAPAPLFDAIYLADGPLYAHQVLQLDLRGVEVVTLSACESALLRFDASDNLHGMAAAFLRAGAAAVVGAMWPVQATVAGTFFVEFYNQLAAGRGKFDAFREAQIATRLAHPQYRDWAAFSMLGDHREK